MDSFCHHETSSPCILFFSKAQTYFDFSLSTNVFIHTLNISPIPGKDQTT